MRLHSTMKDELPSSFSREMGLTAREFLRTLPAAIAPLTYSQDQGKVHIAHPAGTILIELHEAGSRKIASLCLPVTRVDFHFTGLDRVQRSTFMDRFDLCFHRGGG
ncbi:MAG: hypothetical protein H6965_06130 [Chromatiaceae bacterium]|nr:hypothetical protein [Chromatiaceae bacterium]